MLDAKKCSNLAEREGFEPSVPVTQYARLAIWCLRPLGHLSASKNVDCSTSSAGAQASPKSCAGAARRSKASRGEPRQMTKYFLVENDGPITTITFNRPERRNCLDEAVILDFEGQVQAVRDDRECRVLIVTGKGTAFCAGADRAMFEAPAGAAIDAAERRRRMGEFGKRWPRLIGRAFDVLAHLDQITIGAINGYAVGGGWSFALAF